jgi:hypothetical protein
MGSLFLCTYSDFGGCHRTQIGLFEAETAEEAVELMAAEIKRLNPHFKLLRCEMAAVPVGKMLTLPTPRPGCGV